MTGETKTAAVVATTLGMATITAMVAVIAATTSRADADTPKILDRISDTRPAIGTATPAPEAPLHVEIADLSGTPVYRADPARQETVIAKDVPQTSDRIPVPMARSEAILGAGLALAVPLPRPDGGEYRVGMPLPRPETGPATVELASVSSPLPRPVAEIDLASVRQPLPRPASMADVPWPTGPGDAGMVHLTAYSNEGIAH